MVPLALIAIVAAIILTVRNKEWITGAVVFVAGILCAATPAGVWITTNLNKFVGWIQTWGIFH
jgi:hypothetical protein